MKRLTDADRRLLSHADALDRYYAAMVAQRDRWYRWWTRTFGALLGAVVIIVVLVLERFVQ